MAESPASPGESAKLLSDRELHVFRLIGAGFGTRQIAKELCLSPKTIETYRENIKTKLRLRNREDLVQRAREFAEQSGSAAGKMAGESPMAGEAPAYREHRESLMAQNRELTPIGSRPSSRHDPANVDSESRKTQRTTRKNV